MNPEHYQNLIVGSGTGGKLLAWHLASLGQRTAVVERRYVGGSCPNINCLPSKNEIVSAKAVHTARHAADFGVATGPVSVDMAAVRRRKRDMVEGLIAVHRDRYKASGAELVMGEAMLTGPRTLLARLNGGGLRSLTCERLFLDLGTRPDIPAVPGLAESSPLTNIEALDLDRLPAHLVIIGAGYVGLELAQAYRRFGSRVTVIQSGPQALEREDSDVAAEIVRILSREGIRFLLSTEIERVSGRSGAEASLAVRGPGGGETIAASDILVAAGRVPNTAGIGLDAAGVKVDRRGYIRVNDRLETTTENVWAIGESAGSPHFTHVSEDDFRIIRENLAGGHRSTRDRLVPYCLFTDPQLAHVGLTETEARRRGVSVGIVKVPTAATLRTWTTGEKDGFVKALVDPQTDRILGFTMIGAEAGEVMTVVQMAMLAGLPSKAVRDAILTHPTMSEGLGVLFSQTPVAAGARAS